MASADDRLDPLLAELAAIASQQRQLEQRRAELLEVLAALHEAGLVEDSFCAHGCSFGWSAGRRSYTFPPDIQRLEQQLKDAKAAAIAADQASPQPLRPFWTIKPART